MISGQCEIHTSNMNVTSDTLSDTCTLQSCNSKACVLTSSLSMGITWSRPSCFIQLWIFCKTSGFGCMWKSLNETTVRENKYLYPRSISHVMPASLTHSSLFRLSSVYSRPCPGRRAWCPPTATPAEWRCERQTDESDTTALQYESFQLKGER